MSDKKKHIERLKNDLLTQQKIAAFVGAGVSKNIGIKTWIDILKSMIVSFDLKYSLEENIQLKKLEQIASNLYDLIMDDNKYRDFLCDQFKPTKGYYNSLTNNILKTFKIILTTNFDTSFETAFNDIMLNEKNKSKFNIQKLPDFKVDEILLSRTLVYLHGNNDIKNYIFREEEYKTFYATNYNTNVEPSLLEDFLKVIFQKYNLVFIGFSFEDLNLVTFYRKTIKEYYVNQKKKYESLYNDKFYNEPPYSYALIPNNEIETTFSELELKSKIKEDWGNICDFFICQDGKFILKEDCEELFKTNVIKEETKKKLLQLDKEIKKKQEKLNFFKEMNMKVITYNVTDENYNELEDIIKNILPSSTDINIGEIEDIL